MTEATPAPTCRRPRLPRRLAPDQDGPLRLACAQSLVRRRDRGRALAGRPGWPPVGPARHRVRSVFGSAHATGPSRRLRGLSCATAARPRQMRREMMRNFAELGQVLRTEPLDRAALEQVFATLKDARGCAAGDGAAPAGGPDRPDDPGRAGPVCRQDRRDRRPRANAGARRRQARPLSRAVRRPTCRS